MAIESRRAPGGETRNLDAGGNAANSGVHDYFRFIALKRRSCLLKAGSSSLVLHQRMKGADTARLQARHRLINAQPVHHARPEEDEGVALHAIAGEALLEDGPPDAGIGQERGQGLDASVMTTDGRGRGRGRVRLIGRLHSAAGQEDGGEESGFHGFLVFMIVCVGQNYYFFNLLAASSAIIMIDFEYEIAAFFSESESFIADAIGMQKTLNI